MQGKERKYPGESLTWLPDPDSPNLESATMTVPMSHFNNTSQSLTIPLLRLRASSPSTNLLLNPGGPGTSGLSLLRRRGAQLRAIVGHNFHLVSFDPRGVNQDPPISAPQLSSNPTPEEVSSWAEEIAASAVSQKYINTPETAADMNTILDALGQQDMYYWGFSYGSLLGQTYAMMFPERSERIIIDGIVNVFEWYTALLRPSQFESRAAVIDGFFDDCFKTKNALSSLAPDAKQLQHKVMHLLDTPITMDDGGILDRHSLYDGLLHDLFFYERWEPLANRLAALLQGDAMPAFQAYGQKKPPSIDGIIIRCNDMVSGKDEWPQGQELLNFISPILEKYPDDASDTMQEYFTRAQWRIPKSHHFEPPTATKTKHPLLIMSMTHDPFTPLSSAHKASQAFIESRVVEIAGYGHTSLAVRSAVAAGYVRRFLNEGGLPDENVYCEADSV